MSEHEVLVEFKRQLLSFFDELIDQFPSEGSFVIARLFLETSIPIKSVMDNFNHKINKDNRTLYDMIKSRNESFFLEHSMFDELGKDNVERFKKIWRSDHFDDEDKNMMWDWVDAFVYLGDKYAKAIGKAV